MLIVLLVRNVKLSGDFMKYKKIFLLLVLSVTLFIGIANIKADRVYTLNKQTKKPLHCYYVSQDKEKITFELVYKNDEFTVADYDVLMELL